MTRKVLCGWPCLLILLAACSSSSTDSGKSVSTAAAKKQDGGSAPDPNSTQAAAPKRKIELNPDNTKIEFTGTKQKPFKGKHDGDFKRFTGSILNPSTDLKNSVIELEVTVGSLETDTPQVTSHLKTADFFNTKFFPIATFASTKIQPGPVVLGNLTINGKTNEIAFPAKVEMDEKNFKLESTFQVMRLDYDMMYQPDAVDNPVTVRVFVNASLEEPAP